jgi:uncharacterized membrane protein YsdA (DUF1294 family)
MTLRDAAISFAVAANAAAFALYAWGKRRAERPGARAR